MNDRIQTIAGEPLYAECTSEYVAVYRTSDDTLMDSFTVSEYKEMLQDGYMQQGDNALRINW